MHWGMDGHSGISNSVIKQASAGGAHFVLSLLESPNGDMNFIVHGRVMQWTGWADPNAILLRLGFERFRNCNCMAGECYWLHWARIPASYAGIPDPQTTFQENAVFDEFVRQFETIIPQVLSVERALFSARFKFPWDQAKYEVLEVKGAENFFPSGREFDAFKALVDLVKPAKHEILLIDPYVNQDTVDVLSHVPVGTRIRVLTHKIQGEFVAHARRLHQQRTHSSVGLEIRTTKEFHDRFLMVDDVWYHIGTSINSVGQKAFMFAPLTTQTVIQGIAAFAEETWRFANVYTL
ncbi:hypothetical protein [Alicyclobacillus suci]|uniref:hypothetical protein n=1 Tax=Alicyclobacillus suci TaxID=2816080 RepID=UPI001A8BF610|nr:hypothetical protein [Alicyclobacillus suci]